MGPAGIFRDWSAPIKVNSSEEMLAKVASTPGAIGYLWRANISENVNVLQIK